MNKLKLDIDDLTVDSFELATTSEDRGTVHGAEGTDNCSQYCGWTSLQYYLGGTWMNNG